MWEPAFYEQPAIYPGFRRYFFPLYYGAVELCKSWFRAVPGRTFDGYSLADFLDYGLLDILGTQSLLMRDIVPRFMVRTFVDFSRELLF